MYHARNPVFLGVGVIDQEDHDASLVHSTKFEDHFKASAWSASRLKPSQIAALNRSIMEAVAGLPPALRQRVLTMAHTARLTIDPRKATGLGADPITGAAVAAQQVSSTSAMIANIAGVVASLATVGIGIAQFIQQKKMQKEDARRQDDAAAQAKAQADQEITARKQALDQSKASFDNDQKLKRLAASGLMLDASGNVIEKPKASSTAVTGGVIAAAVGAFFLTK